MRIITEGEFRLRLKVVLMPYTGHYKAVTGPGRSGAIAAVYTSHLLGIPYIPLPSVRDANLPAVLVIDTASQSGRTMRKALKQADTPYGIILYTEPPRVEFWYEHL